MSRRSNIEKYYDIRGDGIARLNIKKAIKSKTFKKSVLRISKLDLNITTPLYRID